MSKRADKTNTVIPSTSTILFSNTEAPPTSSASNLLFTRSRQLELREKGANMACFRQWMNLRLHYVSKQGLFCDSCKATQ